MAPRVASGVNEDVAPGRLRDGAGPLRGGVPRPVQLVRGAEGDTHEQAGRGGGGDPARRPVRARGHDRPRERTRELDDAGGAADVFEPPRDLPLLRVQPLGREDRVGLGVRVLAQAVQELRELGVAAAARPTIREMLGGDGIDSRPCRSAK